MAQTSYLTRIIYKEHTSDTAIAGTYNLMLAAKSMPNPVGAPNSIEATTYEDGNQTFAEGIKTNDSKEVTGNADKSDLARLDGLKGKKLDIFQMYGSDGIGGLAKYYYTGTASGYITDMSGVDSIIEMAATIIPNSPAELVTDKYTVTDNADGTFTIAVKSA